VNDAQVLTKRRPHAPPGFFAAEVAGLWWLREAPGGPPVPEVVDAGQEHVSLRRVRTGEPSPGSAEEFGRRLAALHAAGAPAYGADWPGFIGPLPMDNTPDRRDWASWWAQRRVHPLLAGAGVDPGQRAVLDRLLDRLAEVAGPPEPVARLHGDLWSGNVLWGADGQVWLIDPAAHGGHRETDLAMLALFGLPHLNRVLAAYAESAPLAEGWQDRVALHQVWPLLVHAVLYGGAYRDRAVDAARRAGA
jgi:fructosamine-3-kinase